MTSRCVLERFRFPFSDGVAEGAVRELSRTVFPSMVEGRFSSLQFDACSSSVPNCNAFCSHTTVDDNQFVCTQSVTSWRMKEKHG